MSFFMNKATAKAKLVGVKAAITVLPAPRPMVFAGEGSALQLCQALAGFAHKKCLLSVTRF